MNSKARKVLKYVLTLGIAVVLVWLVFRKVDWADFWTGLKSCNYWLIIATMAIQWLVTYLRGNRWRIMMLPLSREITRRESYDAYAVCYLSNMVIPRSGEVVRCGMIADTRKASFEGSLGTVVIERTWDMVCLVLTCIPLLFAGGFRDFIVEKMLVPAAESRRGLLIALALVTVALIAAVVLLYVKRESVSRTKAGAKVVGFCKGLVDGVKAVFKMDRKWAFIAYSVLIWVGYWLCSLLTIRAFPQTDALTGFDALFLMIVGSLGWIVPVQGGFGVYHFLVAMTLVPIYGIPYETGLIFATISHESQIVQMLLCGIISLISWAIYKKHVLNRNKQTI